MLLLIRGYTPPGGPGSVESLPKAIQFILLEYITPGTVVTYGVELLRGIRPGDLPSNEHDVQVSSRRPGMLLTSSVHMPQMARAFVGVL